MRNCLVASDCTACAPHTQLIGCFSCTERTIDSTTQQPATAPRRRVDRGPLRTGRRPRRVDRSGVGSDQRPGRTRAAGSARASNSTLRPGGRGRVVDDDGTVRDARRHRRPAGEQVAWHWWSDAGELSSVELRIDEHDGHTRLRIVETTLLPAGTRRRRATAASTGARAAGRPRTSRLWCHVGAAAFA